MNWQIIVYLSSILLTCILTGFLSWYAWKHRQVPGSSAYAFLALSECLLALTEILSVFSPSMTSALFWFQARYLIGAFIAVFWLVFALEYSGHREWFSKRLLSGMFVIPLTTQILFWSNSLHSLWMKQEAAFYQIGRLWIADISSRVPEIGYMTHSFYNLFLTLAGIALMLLTAWRMRHELVGQALLLAGAGLTALFFVLNSLFGLLPKMEFNIFTPGIGLSVLLIALAVFRFEFLKRAPAQEDDVEMTRLDMHEKYSLAGFILTFILFTSGLAAVSYVTYQNYEEQFRAQVDGELSAIAELKMSGIVNWRSERMSDAEAIHENPVFAELAQKSLENPDDAQTEAKLQTWLDTVRNSYGYDRVFLLDAKGVEQVSSPATLEPVADHLRQQVAVTLKTGQVTFLDFHRDSSNGSIHLALLVPIYMEHDLNRPLGLLVLRIDPTIYLYPYISQWPTISQTAETLLVRRDGNDILYLNELKFQQNAALNFRVPLDQSQVLAVQAVQGATGIVQGVDYRDVEVIGYADAIPDSPWYLIARMDTAEVYAPLRARLWQTIFFFGALVLAAGAWLMLSWRQQRVRFYRRQIETAEALRKSEEQYRGLIEHASDGIFIANAGGKYLEVNPSGCAMLGYTREEILSKQISELVAPENIAAAPLRLDELRQGKTVLSERCLIRKDGMLLPVEISGRMLPDGRFQSITRDITARKQNELEVARLTRQIELILESAGEGIYGEDLNGKITFANPVFARMLGWEPADLLGKHGHTLYHHTHADGSANPVDECQVTLALLDGEAHHVEDDIIWRKDGTSFAVEYTSTPVREDGRITGIVVVVKDITKRKLAEEALREREERLRLSLRAADQGMYDLNAQTGDAIVNEEYVLMLGYDPETFVETNAAWIERLHPDDKDTTAKAYTDYINGDTSEYRVEFRQKTRSGDWKWILSVGKIVEFDASGKPLRMLGTHTDITERKQAEKSLEESETRFRMAVVNAPFPIMIHAENGKVELINEEWMKVTGYSQAEILTIADWTEKAYGNRMEKVREDIEKLYGITGKVDEGDYIIITKTGEKRDWHFSSTPLGRTQDGRRIAMSMALDVTERRHAEQKLAQYSEHLEEIVEERTRELREAQEQLVRQERLAALGQLAGSIGHELRNPLGVISNAVYFLKLIQPDASEKVREYLDIIETETRTSDKIVTDLLDFTRIKSLDRQPVSVSELLRQTLERYPIPSSIETVLQIPADLPQIYADPQHVIQVLVNLISNACQSMDSGVTNGMKLTVSAAVQSAMIKIEVQDTGKGIPPENMKKIFEPLFTTKTKGIGLGLAVSRKLLEANGGRIEVESEADKGSTFTVYLPVYEES